MNRNNVLRKNRLTAVVLLLGICLFLTFAPIQAQTICEKALTRCLVDAAIALIISGPQAAAVYAGGCVNGYIWCLKYYVDFRR